MNIHTAARMALDALERCTKHTDADYDAITALRSALAAPMPEPWMPIETAPKHTEILVWREDSGPFIAKLTTPDAVVSPEEMEREGLEFPDDFEEWWSDAYGWQEGGEKPTHWMPLPAEPGAAPPAAPVPGDMVMVPREPTPEQIAAIPFPSNVTPNLGVACYRAMIAAAPAQPVVPLTDERIRLIYSQTLHQSLREQDTSMVLQFARAVLSAAPVVREPSTYRQIAEATGQWADVPSDKVIGIWRAAEQAHGIGTTGVNHG